jgi:hypothetical protein
MKTSLVSFGVLSVQPLFEKLKYSRRDGYTTHTYEPQRLSQVIRMLINPTDVGRQHVKGLKWDLDLWEI